MKKQEGVAESLAAATSQHRADRVAAPTGRLENAARAELEAGTGQAFTDSEWIAVRARLLEFAALLCRWEHKKAEVRENANVREPWLETAA